MTATIGTSAPSEVFDLDTAAPAASRLREEWNRLAAECNGTSYFQTADWIWSWWETVAERTPTRVACWRSRDGELDAVAAVSRGRAVVHRRLRLSVPAMTLAGSGPGDADHCGAIARPERRADVATWLRSTVGGRTLVASGLAAGIGIAPRGARVVEATACPRLALDSGVVEPGVLESGVCEPAGRRVGRSSNFRTQLNRFARRIARAGVTFEWQPAGAVSPAAVMELFELHWRLRRSRGQSTTLEWQHRELLLRCVERAGTDRGPAAVVARKGDDVVGVLLGFWWQGTFSAYQKGWEPSYAPFSIGSLLVAEAIGHSAAAGADTFDFLRGTEDYKYRFGAVDHDDATVVVPNGVTGALLMARSRALLRPARRPREG
jgi:CelD/BcsL family acetyltransferase involved in cellulose biosynthesis